LNVQAGSAGQQTSWGDEQDRLTRKARLLISSPEEVFRELRSYGQQIKADRRSYDEQLEATLIDRSEPLIDLGLACYAANKDVVSKIYTRAAATTENLAEARQRKGLRIGCLSNQSVKAAQFSISFSFPESVIGAEETQRILAEGDWDEVEAMICNPSINDELLEALYQRGEPAGRLQPVRPDVAAPSINFSKLPDDRWLNLVILSSKNERLKTEKDTFDSPDMGHFHIHEAIFQMLEIAPLTVRSLAHLYHFFLDVDFKALGASTANDKIDHVLARWHALDDRSGNGEPHKGYYTPLPFKDEFRCMIAAIYGGKFYIQGNFNAPDVVVRTAYYAKAVLSVEQMQEGHKRDGDVFTFAALFNSYVLEVPELRQKLEDVLSPHLSQKYRQNCEQLHKRLRWFDPQPLSGKLKDKNEIEPQDKLIEGLIAPIGKRTEDLSKQINKLSSELRWLGFLLAAALALLFIFRKWNGGG
jgi:hypothetical protein